MTVSTRNEESRDNAFLDSLIRQTITEELGAEAWPEPLRNQVIDMQYGGRRLHAGPGGHSLIVLVDGIPSGWMFLSNGDDHIHLVEIMLSPEQRGKGVGAEVLDAIIGQARQEAKPVRLHVNVTNTRAQRFYQRLGFLSRAGDAVQQVMEFPVA